MSDEAGQADQVQRQAKRVSPISGVAPPEGWKPGQSGNPGGAPVGQTYPGRWLGPLADLTDAELRAVLDDDKASRSKRAAAQILLDTADVDPNVRRRAFAEILDRTQGKAHQTQTVEHKGEARPDQVLTRIQQLAGIDVRRKQQEPTGN